MTPDPLNKDCFFPPKLAKSMAAARGLSGGAQNGGMTDVQRIHLSVGQNYYRFCDSTRFASDPVRAAGGGWWIDYETFLKLQAAGRDKQTMKDYAAKQGQPGICYAAKLYLAVPYEWGDCGAVICARLTARIDAFKGKGLTAYLSGSRPDPRDGDAKYTPLQDSSVGQLFIPELDRHFARAFTVVQQGPASQFA